jgi:lysozyme
MMNYSKQGLELTENFESCQLTAWKDQWGVWNIGWSHTGPEVVPGLQWTQVQADSQLVADYVRAENCVNTTVKVALTQGEFDALVDFTYNCGCSAFSNSTMLRLLNTGAYSEAAEQFDLWDHAGGKVVSGLLRRREAETSEFTGGI